MSELRIYNLPLSREYGSRAVLVALQDMGITSLRSASSRVDKLEPLFEASLDLLLWTRRSQREATRRSQREAFDVLKGRLQAAQEAQMFGLGRNNNGKMVWE